MNTILERYAGKASFLPATKNVTLQGLLMNNGQQIGEVSRYEMQGIQLITMVTMVTHNHELTAVGLVLLPSNWAEWTPC